MGVTHPEYAVLQRRAAFALRIFRRDYANGLHWLQYRAALDASMAAHPAGKGRRA